MSAAHRLEPHSTGSLHPTSLRTLVLNADFRPQCVKDAPDDGSRLIETWPLTLITARAAVEAVLRDSAIVVDTWQDAYFRSPSTRIAVPKTIALRTYIEVEHEPKFCRRSILLRDRYTCQYCGEPFASELLTYDHVVPRSRGGRTVWENIVSACIRCNADKANRTPQESGMYPIHAPRQPRNRELLEAGLRYLPNDVRDTWGDFLYWNAELQS